MKNSTKSKKLPLQTLPLAIRVALSLSNEREDEKPPRERSTYCVDSRKAVIRSGSVSVDGYVSICILLHTKVFVTFHAREEVSFLVN